VFLVGWSDRCREGKRISSEKMEELHEPDGAAISAGNSIFYGKNLQLD
jgi:hypothetical protein